MANARGQGLPRKAIRLALATLAYVCCHLSLVAPSQADPPTPAQIATARIQLTKLNTWTNAPWSDSDEPYARIRQIIDQQAVSGEKATVLMHAYDVEVKQNPNYLPGLFADAYAAYWASVLPGGISDFEAQQRMGDVCLIVLRHSPPHTYNFVRLIYLCQTFSWLDPSLKSIGIRLVRAAPGDYQVTFYTVSLLETSPLPKERAQALALAQDLVQRYPSKPNVYSLLASVHYEAWRETKGPAEAAMALADYQKYLQLAPAGYRFRPEATTLVSQLEKVQQ